MDSVQEVKEKEYDEYSTSYQISDSIIKQIDKFMDCNNLDQIFNIVYNELESISLNERMRKDYCEVEEYKSSIRKAFSNELESFNKALPKGLFTKTGIGEYTGCTVFIKSLFLKCFTAKNEELQQLREALRWRDVKEELPNYNKRVLLKDNRINASTVGLLCNDGKFYTDNNQITNITHWCPIESKEIQNLLNNK